MLKYHITTLPGVLLHYKPFLIDDIYQIGLLHFFGITTSTTMFLSPLCTDIILFFICVSYLRKVVSS